MNSGIDQFLRDAVVIAARIHQARDIVEGPLSLARRKADRIDSPSARNESTTSSRLRRTNSSPVTTTSAPPGIKGAGIEEQGGLIDRMGSAGNDQRAADGSMRLASRIRALAISWCMPMVETMKMSGHAAVQLHQRRTEISIPLLKDDAGFDESDIRQCRADGSHARRRHARVGEDKREHPRAMIERAGDHRDQCVLARSAQAMSNGLVNCLAPAVRRRVFAEEVP